jgi:LysM domain
MFSIPVAGLAKAAIVATISLHPAAAHQAHQAPDHYTVKSGDTLSSIARHEYGSATAWPALWWVNRHQVHNPEMIMVGQRLTLSSWHPHKAWLNRVALAAVPWPSRPRAPGRLLALLVSAGDVWAAVLELNGWRRARQDRPLVSYPEMCRELAASGPAVSGS